jgi:hypothetical protein
MTLTLEVFSRFVPFFHIIGNGPTGIPATLSSLPHATNGERCAKYAVHHVVRHRVHPRNRRTVGSRWASASRYPNFGRGQNTGVGWNDPAFCRAVRPKATSGVVPAHSFARKARIVLSLQF